MDFIALLLRPWIVLMNMVGVKPGTLADDLMIKVIGKEALRIFTIAMNTTHTDM